MRRLNIYEPDPLIYQEALGLVRQASLNCYAYDVSARLPCIARAGTSASCWRLLTLIDQQCSIHLLGQLQLPYMTPATRPKWQMQAALHAFRQRGEAWQSRAAASSPQCAHLIMTTVDPLFAAGKYHLLQSVL